MEPTSESRFDPTSENRFDANFVAQILLELAHEQSLAKLLQTLVKRVMERPHIVCAQAWLIEKGDLCATCPRRPECPDQSRCLHLAAAQGSSIVGPGKGFGRLDPETAREPLGVPPIGSVVASGQQRAVPDLNQQPVSSLDPDWMREEGIRGYVINPISCKGETLGAIVSATREPFQDELRPWGPVIANHIGAAIANAHAFEEIRVAGKRLEQANQTLERELAERKETEEKLRQSEQRYRRLVDTASEGIWELDEHYVTTLVNPRMAEMLGYEPKEMVGRKLHEFLFEDDQAEMSARIAARRQGLTERYEQRYRRKDGSAVWMYVSARTTLDAEHRFLGAYAMLTDITERKRAEEALHRLNRELRAISNCNQALLRATDEQSLLEKICRIVSEEAGYRMAWVGYAEHDEAKRVRPVAWTGTEEGYLTHLGITWSDTERGCGPTGTAIRSGKTCCIQDFATDPRLAPWRESRLLRDFRSGIALPLKDEHGNPFGSLTIYSAQPNASALEEEVRLLEELAGDLAFGIVTLRSRAARERAEQQVALLSFALDKGREAAFLINDTAHFDYVNEEACRVLGYSRAELLGLGIGDIDSDFPLERWSDHWRNLKAQRSRTFESRHRTREGRIFPVEISANYFEYGGRAYHLAIVRDITERKRAEELLREGETRFRTFVDHAADALFIYDLDQGTIVDVNRQACESTGYTRQELIGTTAAAIHLDSERAHLESVAQRSAAGESVFDTHWHRRKDGTLFPVETHTSQYWYGGRHFLLKVARDIFERKRAEEALRRLNRQLRAISNCNQVLLRAADEQSLLQEICRIVCQDAGYRVAWVGYAEHDEAKSVRPVAWTGAEEETLANLGITWANTERGRGPSGTAIRTGRTSSIEDYATDPRGAPWRESALQHGFRSAIGLPLMDEHANAFGTLNIYSAQPGAFTSEETRLLEELAADLAFGIVALRSRAARERAEQEVALLSFALDKAREAAFLIDDTAHFRYVNEEACRVLGYSRAELLGMGIPDIDPEFPAARLSDHWSDLKARRSDSFESRHRTRDGRTFPVEISANYFEYGNRPYNLSFARDITERKRAAEEVRNTAAQWQATFDAVQDLVLLLDKDFRILRANRAAAEFLGLPFDKIVGGHCFGLIHGTSTPPAGCPLAKVCHSRRHEEVEVLARKGGPWLSVSVDPIFDSNGEITQVIHVARDITERKRAEEALRRSEAYLAEGQRLTHTGGWAWSLGSAERNYWSEEMYRIFGFESKETPPALERFLQRIHPDDYDRATKDWEKSLRAKADLMADYRTVLPDGTVRDIHILGHPVFGDTGELVEYVGTAVDVTERKRTEEELRNHREHLEDLVKQRTEELAEAKARAEAANRAKGTFLANMSHELRTPLNAVLGFSRLLKNDPDVTPHQQEELDIIVRSGEHLLNLINNVLDMAKIESGRVVLEESEVDLRRLLHEMQSLLGVGAVEKGLRFALEHDPDLPWFVAVDAGKLRQVLLNLLGNAIKYTDSGGVKLRARLASTHGSEKAKVRFEVEDSGPGISQEDCERIFFPFVQLGDRVPTQAGTGLGLAICKQYVELMGGQIGVTSKPGKGSVFYFEIPVRVLPSVAERDELKNPRILGLAEGQPRYRLLIVEDQPENRLLLRRLLEPLGFEFREAANGQEAVALFEQWHPDLIWMDIRMPVMDGLEAVRRIRATQAGADTKIIALTAHALQEEKEPIMAAGCDDLVRKPIREQELFGALARQLRLKFIYEKAPPQESTPESPELAVRPEQLDALPAELVRDLRQAVIELDTARTQALIQQVTERDASLGRALNTLATQLGYKRLLKLLKK
jgi:PAS domain S-box-containing protein